MSCRTSSYFSSIESAILSRSFRLSGLVPGDENPQLSHGFLQSRHPAGEVVLLLEERVVPCPRVDHLVELEETGPHGLTPELLHAIQGGSQGVRGGRPDRYLVEQTQGVVLDHRRQGRRRHRLRPQ